MRAGTKKVEPKLAISLASATVKAATKVLLGPVGDVVEQFTDALLPFSSDYIEARHAGHVLEQCVDIVAADINRAVEYSKVSDNEAEAALLAARDVWRDAQIDVAKIIDSQFNADVLYETLNSHREKYLQTAHLNPSGEVFFEQLLRRTCFYAIATAGALPRTVADLSIAILNRQEVLLREVSAVASTLSRRSGDPEADWTSKYCSLVVSKLDRMEILGGSLSMLHRQYSLDVAFVNISASTHQEFDNADDNIDSAQANRTRIVDIENGLAGSSRSLLIGEAGSGKTTILRWIAVSCAKGTMQGSMAEWNQLIPFYVPLRQFANKELPDIDQLADYVSRSLKLSGSGEIWKVFSAGRALLLLDGLDELPAGAQRRSALQWLEHDLVAQFPRCKYVLTSRPSGLREEVDPTGFSHLIVEPMLMPNIRLFSRRWHEAIREQISDADDAAQTYRDDRALIASLEANRYLRVLASNPLLCAMLCALNRELNHRLPSSRVEIYNRSIEMLLSRRDRARGVREGTSFNITEDLIILQEFALWLMRESQSGCSYDRFVGFVKRQLKRMRPTRLTAEEIVQRYVERSGIVREPAAGEIDFVHRTFQEFLACCAALANDEIGYLLKNSTDDQWREVICLAIGTGTTRQRDEIMKGLLERASESSPDQLKLQLLAIAALQEAPELSFTLRRRVEDLARMLIPPPDQEVSESLAHLGPLVIDAFASRRPKTTRSARASIRLLSLIGTLDAMQLVEQLSCAGEVDVNDELMRAWRLFDIPEFAHRVLRISYTAADALLSDDRQISFMGELSEVRHLQIQISGRATVGKQIVSRPPQLERLEIDVGRETDLEELARIGPLDELILTVGYAARIEPVFEMADVRKLRIRPQVGWFRLAVSDLAPMFSLRTVIIEKIAVESPIIDVQGDVSHSLDLIVPKDAVILNRQYASSQVVVTKV